MKKQLFLLAVLLCFVGITMHAQQRKVMYEHFTSSTCAPWCPQLNALVNPWLAENADKVTVIKYQMNWPGAGDKYYTPEGGTRRSYYGVSGVPDVYVQGSSIGGANIQQMFNNIVAAVNNAYSQPAQATITGTFSVSGNYITIDGSVTPLISGSGYKIHISVNEKKTTGNKGTNGETEFHHVMMKMFPNGNGTDVTLTAGTPIPFNYTYDMSSTHVEEMDDLEVAVFVQNTSTKAILNSAFLDDMTSPAPQNMTAKQVKIDQKDVNITWSAPLGDTPQGYNVYRDNEKINTALVTTTTYQDVAPEFGKIYTYGVGAVVGGTEGSRAMDTVLINITMPKPVITTVKQTKGMEMFIEWEMPTGFSHPVKYYVYRNNIPQNSGNPTSETSFTNMGLSYREYCFEILPVLNAITGEKSASSCVTLINVPQPKNLIAQQLNPLLKEVLLTWDASTSNTAGYNLYRDGALINTTLITATTYTDVVAAYGVEYTYQLHGVAETGGESEKYAEAKITLSESAIPPPANVKAEQQGDEPKVLVTWDPVVLRGDVDGYNVYRDGEKINDALVTETEYLDEVPEAGEYCYTVAAVLDEEVGQLSSPEACIELKVGIGNIDKNELFAIYPNPVSGTLNINAQETITGCQIFNIQGQLIYSTTSDVKEIATDNFVPGTYIIRVITEKGTAEKRFIKN